MDKAPTKPRESAKEDFTIVIIIVVVAARIIKFLENSSLLDSVVANLL